MVSSSVLPLWFWRYSWLLVHAREFDILEAGVAQGAFQFLKLPNGVFNLGRLLTRLKTLGDAVSPFFHFPFQFLDDALCLPKQTLCHVEGIRSGANPYDLLYGHERVTKGFLG